MRSLVCFALVFALGCGSKKTDTEKPANGGPSPAVEEIPEPGEPVDNLKLFMDYQNAASGDSNYKDKWVTFLAVPREVKTNSDGSYTVLCQLYSNGPHGFEVRFEKSKADEVAKLKIGNFGMTTTYVFQAIGKGRRDEFRPRNSNLPNTKYVLLFDEAKVVKELKR